MDWKEEREGIVKRFNEFKAKGGRFTLNDILTDEQKERIKNNAKNFKPKEPELSDKELAKKLISKYISKLIKAGINVEVINNHSITFNFKGNPYYIGYHFGSGCMVICNGTKFNDEDAREIGFEEFKDKFIE